ncbi:MAG: hypothetical protein ABSH38_11435 [Verrucomicrobiota bacterium]|jgi:hypothetical protein
MKTYTITLPAFRAVIQAKSNEEALEQFWFNYDIARDDPEWDTPIIKITGKKHGR